MNGQQPIILLDTDLAENNAEDRQITDTLYGGNGVPNLSVLDGWWVEGCIEGVTGWAVGNSSESVNDADAYALYEKLE